MSELYGQATMDDFIPKPVTDTPAEGYDENGHLMDYVPEKPPARPLEVIAAEINAIKRQTLGVVISAALEIGKRLIEARNQCPRGRWSEWLESNVDYSERKAQDMMKLYESYGDDVPAAIARLDYTKALQILALPEDQREAMAERAEAEGLSTRQLQDEIKRAKGEAEALQTRIEGLETDRQADNQKIFDLHQQLEAAERAIKSQQEEIERAKAAEAAATETAAGMRKVSSKAAEDAARAAQSASDAVQRANEVTAENARLRERIKQLEAATDGEVREVLMPDAEAKRQMDMLRAEIEKLKAGGDDPAADQRRLALALRVRMAAQDVKTHLHEAVDRAQGAMQAVMNMLNQLTALDPKRAEALFDECHGVSRWAQDCADAEPMKEE